MKNYIIVAAISAIVSVFGWEVMHVVTGADAAPLPAPEPQKTEICNHKHTH